MFGRIALTSNEEVLPHVISIFNVKKEKWKKKRKSCENYDDDERDPLSQSRLEIYGLLMVKKNYTRYSHTLSTHPHTHVHNRRQS